MRLLLLFSFSLVASTQYTLQPVSPQMQADASAIISLGFSNLTSAFSRLAYLTDTFGPRFSGSDALNTSLYWLYNLAVSDGHPNVYFEPTMVPRWVRGYEYATMLTPRIKSLHFVGLGMSSGGNITAQVISVRSYDELISRNASTPNFAQGKIVLFNADFVSYGTTVTYRSNAARWASSVGGIGALVKSIGPFSIQSPHTGASTPIPGVPAGAISLEDANQIQRMQDRGQIVTVQLYMGATLEADVPSANIIIEFTGTRYPNEYVIFGGHTDSWDIAEGAMDDGGGMMASIEAARLMLQSNIKPLRTIRAVLFVNEENGSRGGLQYAADFQNTLQNHSIAIESDSGAFAPYALGFTGSPLAKAQLEILGSLLAPINAGNVSDGGGGTDIDPTCSTGVPCGGLLVLDPRISPTIYGFDSSSNNPCAAYSTNQVPISTSPPGDGYFFYHHTTADTMERLDPVQLQAVAVSLAVWATSIASLDQILPRSGDAPLPPSNIPKSNTPAIVGSIFGVILFIGVAFVGFYGFKRGWFKCSKNKYNSDHYLMVNTSNSSFKY
jgi:carboxypeptidase Q